MNNNIYFTQALKSTIDKLMVELSKKMPQSPEVVDLDDIATSQDLFSTNKSFLVLRFDELYEAPRFPLCGFRFSVGGRTVKDYGNYNILGTLDNIMKVFKAEERFDIKNYSGETAGEVLGRMTITDVIVERQEFDKDSGLRMATVVGRVAWDIPSEA